MVRVIYSEVETHLHPAAAMSVLAHLPHMVASGRAGVDGDATLEAVYRPG